MIKKRMKLIYISIIILFVLAIILSIITMNFRKDKIRREKELNFQNSNSQDNSKDIKDIGIINLELQIKSEFLKKINSNPVVLKREMGFPTTTVGDTEIYEKEGVRIKRNFGAITTIVLDKNFKEEIFEGVRLSESYEQILRKMGINEEDIEKNIYQVGNLYFSIYRLFDEFKNTEYIEMAIMPKQDFDYEKFKNLIEKNFNNEFFKSSAKDKSSRLKEAINDITKEFPRYTKIQYDESFIHLEYAYAGIVIDFSDINNGGIYLFKNYQGKAINSSIIKNRENTTIILSQLNEEVDKFLMTKSRQIKKNKFSDDVFVVAHKKNNKFFNCLVLSKKGDFLKSSINSISSADDIFIYKNIVYYIIENDGIYSYNPYTRNSLFIKKVDTSAKILDINEDEINLTNNLKIKR